jgi:rubredoxin
MMQCGFCGYEFNPEEAVESCRACPIASGCHLIRCPRCGYEMPQEARLIAGLRSLLNKVTTARNSGFIKEKPGGETRFLDHARRFQSNKETHDH